MAAQVFIVLDGTVQVKKFFLSALKSIAPSIPSDWDVLFLDCPDACVDAIPKYGVTRIDGKVCADRQYS